MLKSCSNDPQDLCEAEKALQLMRTTLSDSCATLFEICRLEKEKEHFAGVSLSEPLFYRPLRLLICIVLLMQGTFFSSVYRLFGRPMTTLFEYFGDNEAKKEATNSALFLKVEPTSASIFAVVQLATALTVTFLLVRILERRTVLIFSGGVMVILQFILAIAALIDGKEKKESIQELKSIVQYIAAIPATIIESIGWLVIAELPIHEHRTYSVALAWVASWLLTALTINLVDTYGGPSGSSFFFTSSLTMALAVGALYVWMPKKLRGRSCNQISTQFIGASNSLLHVSK